MTVTLVLQAVEAVAKIPAIEKTIEYMLDIGPQEAVLYGEMIVDDLLKDPGFSFF